MDQIIGMAEIVSEVLWGPFVLIPLLFGVGLFLTIRLKLLQLLRLPHALWLALVRRKEDPSVEGDISHYQALSTSVPPWPSVSAAPAPSSGCGWSACSVWPPSTARVYWG